MALIRPLYTKWNVNDSVACPKYRPAVLLPVVCIRKSLSARCTKTPANAETNGLPMRYHMPGELVVPFIKYGTYCLALRLVSNVRLLTVKSTEFFLSLLLVAAVRDFPLPSPLF